MMKTYSVPLGRMAEVKHAYPDRTAYKSERGIFGDIRFQVWSNREAMARSIRMQERGPWKAGNWKAIVPLTDTDGF
jgi:hypothetical protein